MSDMMEQRKQGNRRYLETFDDSSGGWIGSNGNSVGHTAVLCKDGFLRTHSPWWVDYNHAPPGAGYLHILFGLHTKGPFGEHLMEVAGPNRFVGEKQPRDFRDASMTLRLRGDIHLRGSRLYLLVQSKIGDVVASWLLLDQPIGINGEWSEQSIFLANDESKWLWLGARHNRADYYAYQPLDRVLADVNNNILLVLFPLEIAPMGEIAGDPHVLRAGRDYPLWTSRLPEGYVDLDTVEIAFAQPDTTVGQPGT